MSENGAFSNLAVHDKTRNVENNSSNKEMKVITASDRGLTTSRVSDRREGRKKMTLTVV